jgi:hypothetical protein
MARTHEEATEALLAGRESRRSEAAFAGQGAHLEAVRGLQPTVFYRRQKEFFEIGRRRLREWESQDGFVVRHSFLTNSKEDKHNGEKPHHPSGGDCPR